MFEDIFMISSWITASLLVALSWFIYKYSKNFVVGVNYWTYIYSGTLFFAASEMVRPLHLFVESFFMIYLAFSILGAVFLFFGFYRLYEAERV